MKRRALVLSAVLAATGGLVATAAAAQAGAGCRVDYAITSSWQGGFGASVTVTNLGDAVTGWQLSWSFAAGQTVTQLWNGTASQSGAQVTVTNAGYNGNIAAGGTAAFGFNGSWAGSNPVPAAFALNGTTCTGAVATPTATTPPASATPTPSSSPPTGSSARQKVNANRGWKFIRSDVTGAQNPDLNDSSWVPVALPHDFEAPYDVGGATGGRSFHVGVGWYRRHFTVPSSWNGKSFELEFEGAFSVAHVWVNGVKIGTHRGGYTGFAFDITNAIRAGDNQISVRVDNRWRADLAPRTGDHQFSGGLTVTSSSPSRTRFTSPGTAPSSPRRR